jgi:hypothetical protein
MSEKKMTPSGLKARQGWRLSSTAMSGDSERMRKGYLSENSLKAAMYLPACLISHTGVLSASVGWMSLDDVLQGELSCDAAPSPLATRSKRGSEEDPIALQARGERDERGAEAPFVYLFIWSDFDCIRARLCLFQSICSSHHSDGPSLAALSVLPIPPHLALYAPQLALRWSRRRSAYMCALDPPPRPMMESSESPRRPSLTTNFD